MSGRDLPFGWAESSCIPEGVRSAIAAFQSAMLDGEFGVANVYLWYSWRSGDLITSVGDVAFASALLSDFDTTIRRASHRRIEFSEDARFDSEIAYADGVSVLRRCDRARLSSTEQERHRTIAEAHGKRAEFVCADDLVRRQVEVANCLSLLGYLNRAKNRSIVKEMGLLLEYLEKNDRISIGKSLSLATSLDLDPAKVLAALARLVATGTLHFDRSMPLSRKTAFRTAAVFASSSDPSPPRSVETQTHRPPRGPFQNLSDFALDRSKWKLPKSDDARFLKRRLAVDMLYDGANAEDIRKATGYDDRATYDFIRGCASMIDGEPKGYRALLSYGFERDYIRKAPPRSGPNIEKKMGGNAGLFQAALREHPRVAEALVRYYFVQPLQEGQVAVVRPNYAQAHKFFLTKLKSALGITEGDPGKYPWNAADEGRKAVRRFLQDLERGKDSKWVARRRGKNASITRRLGRGQPSLIRPQGFMQAVASDFHKEDVHTTMGLDLPRGGHLWVPVPRWWMGGVVCVSTNALIGQSTSFEHNPSQEDTLELLSSVVSPHKADTALAESYPTVAPDGHWLPNQLVPSLENCAFDVLYMDRALSNSSQNVLAKTMEATGCVICFGPPGDWSARPEIERTFRDFAGQARALRSGVGAHPGDPVYADAIQQARELTISFDRVATLLRSLARERLNVKGASSYYVGQLQRIRELCADESSTWLPRPMCSETVSDNPMLWVDEQTKIERSAERDPTLRKYGIRFYGLTDCTLPERAPVTLQVNRRDVTVARAFDAANGAPLGPVRVQDRYQVPGLPWRVAKRIELEGAAGRGGLGQSLAELAENTQAGRASPSIPANTIRVLASVPKATERASPQAHRRSASTYSTDDLLRRLGVKK